MTHENWLEMADIYSIGALDTAELSLFQAHLASGCLECKERIRNAEGLMANFAKSLTPVPPGLAVKENLMNGIRSNARPLTWAKKTFSPIPMGIAAVLVLSILMGSYLTVVPQKSIVEKAPMHSAAMVAALSDPSVKIVKFRGRDRNLSAFGKLAWNFKNCGGCLVLKKLVQLQADKVFQLWGMGPDKKPIAIGTFTADVDGNAHVDFPLAKDAHLFQQFAVTIEPAGGSLLPTGSIQILGSV